MNNPKISVIIPVYNVADYLDESLNSILNQTFIDDIEVIMVDDGSSDESRYIIERYALDYDNFYAYHKENGGAGVARNYGLQFAKGEYIHFMDPDDYIDSNAYEMLYAMAKENDDCDVVIGNAVRYDRYKIWDENLFKKSFKGFTNDLKINRLTERISILWDTVLWNKLFRTDFVKSNNIQFPNENVIYQDIPFTLKSYVLANSIYITQNIVYYWRLRKKSTSSTQQYENIKTFYDRIKILDLAEKIMNELDVDDEIRNYEYRKWLIHDLKLFLKRLTKFPDEYYDDILSNIHRIVKNIPSSFIDDLNSYRRVMYKMVENDDLDGLIEFSYLEPELMKNPVIPDTLDKKYHQFIDFEKDGLDEEFNIAISKISRNDKNVLLSFKSRINYIDENYPHELRVTLVDGNYSYDLDVVNEKILIPIDLIKLLKHNSYIKARYIAKNFVKESYLKTNRRTVLRFDDFDLEFKMGVNRVFSLNIRKTNDNIIEINEILFENNMFKFIGTSKYPLANIVMENVITFEKHSYPIDYEGDQFNFTIPYETICKAPIRKWEIKSDSLFNTMQLPKKMEFYMNSNKVLFLNSRNKILIEEDIYNRHELLSNSDNMLDEIKENNRCLKEEHKTLKKTNKILEKENVKLNNKVDEYKSRKIIRIVDTIKR